MSIYIIVLGIAVAVTVQTEMHTDTIMVILQEDMTQMEIIINGDFMVAAEYQNFRIFQADVTEVLLVLMLKDVQNTDNY